MSTPTLAQKDPAIVLSEALALYKSVTGISLAPADPRRLHLLAFLLLLAQQRQLIDFSGKQSLLRHVSDQWIDELADLQGEPRIAARPSECILRFTAVVPAVLTIPAGKRATDGTSTWAVVSTTTSSSGGANYVDARALAIVDGAGTNGVALDQIATLVDSVDGIASVTNVTETTSGRDLESLEDFRLRLRSIPMARSVAGPRLAYEELARAASASVDDVAVLGPDDAAYMTGAPPAPGEVFILIMEVDLATPSGGLIGVVETALSPNDVRPLGDDVHVMAPTFADFDIDLTYYISRAPSDSVIGIRAAVEAAFEAYKTWQRKIGRDINPSKLNALLVAAGAHRTAVTLPAYQQLDRDVCSRLGYETLTYGGVEDD